MTMEDIRRRLELKNPSVQIQTAWKLYQNILKKITPEKPLLNFTSPEIVDVKLLLEHCSEGDNVVVTSCCCIVLELVRAGKAEFTSALNGLLNLVPSARNLSGIIQGVKDLLLLQVALETVSGHSYRCPYSIRSPPHPFITILTNRPEESWPLLQQEVYVICCHANKSSEEHVVSMLAPFLKFVLLNPQPSQQLFPLRQGLQGVLLQTCRSGSQRIREQLMSFLINHIAVLQIDTLETFSNASDFVIALTDIAVKDLGVHGHECLDKLIRALLGLLSCAVSKTGWPGLRITDMIHQTARHCPQVIANEDILVSVTAVMLSAPTDLLFSLLSVVKIALTTAETLCPVVIGMAILPVVQILALPASTILESDLKRCQHVAAHIINLLQMGLCIHKTEDSSAKLDPPSCQFLVTSQLYLDSYISNQAKIFSSSTMAAVDWLKSLKKSLDNMNSIPRSLTNLVVALLATSGKPEVTNLALEIIADVSNKDHCQAPSFLPVLLYELGRHNSPERRLSILNTIPAVATHKVCVPPILQTIHMLGKDPQLRAVSLCLLTSLWKAQERCFPQLYSALEEDVEVQGPRGAVNEWLVAKAASLREVCIDRPHQHGADLLSPLSNLLNNCTGDEGGVPTALALEALYALCNAEVIDARSAWSTLADTFNKDNRPVVVQRVCSFLSLAASIDLSVQHNEVFQQEAVCLLWSWTQSPHDLISGAAYRALSAFSVNSFSTSMLPPQIIADFVKEAATHAELKEDPSVTVDSLYPTVPPVCYIRLLTSLQPAVLIDFSVFLFSVVSREVNNLPRGIYNSARIRGALSSQSKALIAIPAFLSSQYESCKQPGVRPALAASLLFSFDAVLEAGRGGRPRQRHFIDRRKKFLTQLPTLLQEVPVQPSEWHRNMSLPRGWSAFMDRAYTAVVQGREAEIELQGRHEQLHPDDALEKKKSAWLWARDTLTDIIKAASRGNPSCQANSIFALAGLAATVNGYSTGLDPEDLKNVSQEHMGHSHWLAVVMDTLMSLMDVKFQPSGQLLGMCQQRGVIDRQEASVLARSAASVAISQVIPAVMTFDTDRIYKMIDMLRAGLPGHAPSNHSGVLQSHCGLGLGMLLARLFEEHFTDVGGTKGMTEVWKALDVLEQCCLQSTADHRQGSMLGLGVALGSLCSDSKTDSRVHVLSLCEKLLAMLDSLSPVEDTFQACCVSLAALSSAAFSTNILSSDSVTHVVEKLTALNEKHSENTGLCLSIGMLGHSLAHIGHPGASSANEKLALEWQKKLSAEDVSPLQKVAVLTGLMALCGSELPWAQVQSSTASEMKDAYSADVISRCKQIVESHGDLGIQGAAAWLLGHLHLSACSVTETRASAPSSFSYLPDSSVIRAVVDFLLEAGKQGPDVIPVKLVEISLSSLLENVRQALPPVNWTGVLSPLMRGNFGVNVACLCLKLAVSQSVTSSAASLFVTTWLAQSLFASLDDMCQQAVFVSLPKLIKSISPSILRKFLARTCAEQFTASPPKGDNCRVILQGLLGALQVPDPPEAVTSLLYETTELFYSVLPKTLEPDLYSLICDCLAELPDERFDLIVVEDFTDPANHIRGAYVRCHLVAKGKQPVALLNGCIDATMNNPQCDKHIVLNLLAQCFYQISLTTGQSTSVIPRLQWFLELMGHTKNIAVEALPLRVDNTDQALPLAVEFGLQCVAAAICLWTSPVFGGVIGVQPGCFSSPSSSDQPEVPSVNFDTSLPYFPALLPACIENFDKPPWDQILVKVLDWLWVFSQLPDHKLSPENKQHCIAAMLALRHTQDFKKNVMWTKVLAQTKVDTKSDVS